MMTKLEQDLIRTPELTPFRGHFLTRILTLFRVTSEASWRPRK